MHRLIYCSKTSRDLGIADLKNILEVAQIKNKEHGVTGALFYNAQFFIQCLEGPRRALNDTFQRISKDGRHADIFLLSYFKIDHRDFGDWSMGIASAKSVILSIVGSTLSMRTSIKAYARKSAPRFMGRPSFSTSLQT